jgi:hypothetical protein
LIVHQGTLSGFDLVENRLFAIHGERDTFGGWRSPPWARNEWHGPARGGVASDGKHLYWQTGSRVLCLVSEGEGPAGTLATIKRSQVPTRSAAAQSVSAHAEDRLSAAVTEVLDGDWRPLFIEPGLAGRHFPFDDSGELFEALAWAFPHLPAGLQEKAKVRLAEEWQSHAPFTASGWYGLKAGKGREWFAVPDELRTRVGADKQPHPFGNVYAVFLYGERCGATGSGAGRLAQDQECVRGILEVKLAPRSCERRPVCQSLSRIADQLRALG